MLRGSASIRTGTPLAFDGGMAALLHRPRVTRVVLAHVIVVAVAGSFTPAFAQQAEGEYAQEAEASSQEVPIGVDGDTYEDTDPSALTDFRATLDPHGSWFDDPTYGSVWV